MSPAVAASDPNDVPGRATAGSHILVIGGSRGIGAAVVRAAAARGDRVTFTYASDAAAAEELVDELGPAVGAVRADARDTGHAAAVLEEATRARGDVDVVVNNAGTTGRLGPFVESGEAELRAVFELNVFATMAYSKAAAETWLRGRRAGVIVNVSSIAASSGSPGEYVGYAASKAAVETFTRGLGRELAPAGIRVVAVAPGTTRTDIHARAGDPDRPARVAARVPLGRVAEPDEIARVILWAASPEASYVTATTVAATGGL
jgi:NAD(P)-dependent dehydrogenase (short-subunit alcohol dehydrogenase family)